MKNDSPPSKYEDIIDLPHPVSRVHPPMSMHDRAAQFMPFAALVGYEDLVRDVLRQSQQIDDHPVDE